MKNILKNRDGFELIEFLIVMAIIGLLAALLIPAIGEARKFSEAKKLTEAVVKECGVRLDEHFDKDYGISKLTYCREEKSLEISMENPTDPETSIIVYIPITRCNWDREGLKKHIFFTWNDVEIVPVQKPFQEYLDEYLIEATIQCGDKMWPFNK